MFYTDKFISRADSGMKTWHCWKFIHSLHILSLSNESCRGEDWIFWGDYWGNIHLLHVWDILVEPKKKTKDNEEIFKGTYMS